MTAPRVALVSDALQYAGPGSVAALSAAGWKVLAHDPSFADEVERAQFVSAHPDVDVHPVTRPIEDCAVDEPAPGTGGRARVAVRAGLRGGAVHEAAVQESRAIVREHAPMLASKTFYGMPGWALDGKVCVFMQPASKFKVRYCSIGFEPIAQLDDGDMWPTSFAILKIGPAEKKKITALVKKAVS